MGRFAAVATTIVLAGCRLPQDMDPGPSVPPASLPDVSTIDAIEVTFGDKTRIVSDRSKIEGFVSFIQSLESGWRGDTGTRVSGGAVWLIHLKSGDDEVAGFGYLSGEFAWHVPPYSPDHKYGIRTLTDSESQHLIKLLDFNSDLAEAGLGRR